LIRTYMDWTVIRSPIHGVVLEKLVDPNELVVPQSFGGTRGPSTALIALADPKDLQVEIELNESDVAKVSLNQACRVSPEAYPDKVYAGYVAEMAPEANRQKGTLQIKVQIRDPDHFLTPELSAKVDFLSPAANAPGK
jgi:HlyD family secretion protein